ncbi:hypothetical protein GCM10027597_50290 [Saccharopolyspora tripterygii]
MGRVSDSANLHAQYAAALEEDAARSDNPCAELVDASGHWHMADDHERELSAVTRAFEADDDSGPLSGRGAYIAYLLTHGRAEEATPLLDELRRKPSGVAMTYMDIHAGYASIGRISEGLRWLNAGANHIVPSLDEPLAATDQGYDLLLERRQARIDAGLPADAMDEFLDQCVEHNQEMSDGIQQLSGDGGELDGLVDANGNLMLRHYAVPLWTAEEFARSTHEHPEWWEEGATHESYRRQVEEELSAVTKGACLVPTTVDAVEAYLRDNDYRSDVESPDDYAFEEAHNGNYLPWPPGRNDTCWCDSGRKYKKCCGAPGFV